ncbi:MAG TPA: Gldg family protein [Pseudomonadota bacterium]|jgi:hypothetical protein|nr:Gldg family protein [Pseudomonadota bacterium]HNN52399.1 Gldg family protein [Pseudomonadota bacterium]
MAEKRTSGGHRPKSIQVVLWPTVLFFVGLFVLFLGERMLTTEGPQKAAAILSALLLVAGFVGLLSRRGSAKDAEEKRALGYMMLSGLLVIVGVVVYLLFHFKSPGLQESLRSSLGKNYEKSASMAQVFLPMMVLLGVLPLAFIQQAIYSMTDGQGGTEAIEPHRVSYAVQSGLSVALVAIFIAAGNYVVTERNTKIDLARFQNTKPGETTRKVVQSLSRPIQATLFFPTANEVREQVQPYFDELGKLSPNFQVQILDHALEPVRAKEMSVSGNGMIVLTQLDEKGKPGSRETINIGLSVDTARGQLLAFDSDVQKKLLLLSRPGRVVYFTSGHGERSFDTGAMDLMKDDLRLPVGALRTMMVNLGYEVRSLSVQNGLAGRLPQDAGLVVIAGPTERFLAEEVSALSTFIEEGGHLLLLLDPTAEQTAVDLAPVLKKVGLKYTPQVLCHPEKFAVRTHKDNDRENIVSTSFSSHVSVTTLSRNSGRAGVILPKSGFFEREPVMPAGVQLDFTLRSMPNTFADTNRNFQLDAGEKSQVFELAAVAQKLLDPGKDGKSKRELRLVALGSADAMSDGLVPWLPNRVLIMDSVKWLMQEEAILGEPVQDQDVPIVHTKGQEKLWFWLTTLLLPSFVLGVGLLYTRSVRRRRSS